MGQPYNINSSVHGVNGFGRQLTKSIFNARLADVTATALAVPDIGALGLATTGTSSTNKFLAVISYEDATTVFVAVNQTADAPAGATFAADTSVINPSALYVNSTDALSFYAIGADTDVSVEFYAIQE